jgi:hypothetical protein
MGYPYPVPKKFLRGFIKISEVVLEASGGFKPPKPPVASPLIIIFGQMVYAYNAAAAAAALAAAKPNFFPTAAYG